MKSVAACFEAALARANPSPRQARHLVLVADASSESDDERRDLRRLALAWERLWRAETPRTRLYWALMPLDELRARVAELDEEQRREVARLQSARGIPTLPARGLRAARMTFLEMIDLVSRGRREALSGELATRWRADMLRMGWDAGTIAACLADTPTGSREESVFSVRWLMLSGIAIGGVTCTLPDLNAAITDEDLGLAIDVWSRPPRRPRNDEPRLPERWLHFAKLCARVGLERVSPAKIEREWRAWRRARGVADDTGKQGRSSHPKSGADFGDCLSTRAAATVSAR